MKKILSLFAVTTLVLAACSKDSGSGTKPEISFKSYSIPFIVDSLVDNFDVSFQVKDGDGDIENLFYFQTIIDSDPLTAEDTVYQFRQMPNIGAHKGSKVDDEVIYNMISSDFKIYNINIKPDSLRLRVFIIDEAGHSSDTILTPKLGIIKD